MIVYKNLDDLVEEYIKEDIFLTGDELSEMRNCIIVVEDILPSGTYKELANGEICVY